MGARSNGQHIVGHSHDVWGKEGRIQGRKGTGNDGGKCSRGKEMKYQFVNISYDGKMLLTGRSETGQRKQERIVNVK